MRVGAPVDSVGRRPGPRSCNRPAMPSPSHSMARKDLKPWAPCLARPGSRPTRQSDRGGVAPPHLWPSCRTKSPSRQIGGLLTRLAIVARRDLSTTCLPRHARPLSPSPPLGERTEAPSSLPEKEGGRTGSRSDFLLLRKGEKDRVIGGILFTRGPAWNTAVSTGDAVKKGSGQRAIRAWRRRGVSGICRMTTPSAPARPRWRMRARGTPAACPTRRRP